MATRKSKKAPERRRGRLQQRAELAGSARAFPRMQTEQMPRRGWIRAIRDALGISQSQLAARMGVSRATVQQMERAEARRRITLASLDRLAHAMGCTVAFAILPKGGTLEHVRRAQAFAQAELILRHKLAAREDGATELKPRELERRRERIAAKLLRGSTRKLWRVETPVRPVPDSSRSRDGRPPKQIAKSRPGTVTRLRRRP